MARCAAFGGPACAAVMIRVVEHGVEPFSELHGKCFDLRVLRFQIRMADRTYRLLFSDPLIHVTADAGFVSAELTFCAFRFALMTGIALELQMLRNLMRKILKRFG